MSAWAVTWAYEQDLKPCGKKAILVALAHFADVAGFCFPSQETLAGMTSQGPSTVRSHLADMEDTDKIIIREFRYDKRGKRTSDGFHLQAPADRLLPPQKDYRRNSAVAKALPLESSETTAEIQPDYRRISAPLPPKLSGDQLMDQSEEQSEKKKTPQRGARLPADFSITEDMRKWGTVYTPHLDLDSVLPEFTDYWAGVPGVRGTKLDWEATWRNRMRELESRAAKNGNGYQPSSKASRTQDVFARLRTERQH